MSLLPYPRVRDTNGWTAELYWFLRKKWRVWVCPSGAMSEPCKCAHCAIDVKLNKVWEERAPPRVEGVPGPVQPMGVGKPNADGCRWVSLRGRPA